jgi:hypothetical protein
VKHHPEDDYYFCCSSSIFPPKTGWQCATSGIEPVPNVSVAETEVTVFGDDQEKKKEPRGVLGRCCFYVKTKLLAYWIVDEFDDDDNRTFLGGLTSISYIICSFGLLLMFAGMFIYYNEEVVQAIQPLDEELVSTMVSDIEVNVRFLVSGLQVQLVYKVF